MNANADAGIQCQGPAQRGSDGGNRSAATGNYRLIADAAIQAEPFIAIGRAAAFPQQLPVAVVLPQHLRGILIVDTVLQQQEVAAQIGSVFKAHIAEIGE